MASFHECIETEKKRGPSPCVEVEQRKKNQQKKKKKGLRAAYEVGGN